MNINERTNQLSINNKEYIFIEKYRPKTITDLSVPMALKEQMKEWVKDDQIPNLLLSGRTPGTGKTSLCHTLIHETGADALFLNASLYPNIDVLRSKIQGFVSTSSFDGNPKIVVLDEADFLNANSTQPALRGFIESFSKNARFILTCNYPMKIIEPLRNRLINIDFDDMTIKNKNELIKDTLIRTLAVLNNEKIEYDMEDIKWIIKNFYPSSRAILNKIQEHTINKKLVLNKDEIDNDSLNNKILENIHKNEFENLRKNTEKMPDPSSLFMILYENLDDFPQALRPGIIIIIAKYQSYDSQVRDRTINSVACATEIMDLLQKSRK